VKTNITTDIAERMVKMMVDTSHRLKEMAELPYGVRPATKTEQRQKYDNLTPDQLFAGIRKEGIDKTNSWLSTFERKP
jgi:hypothetical protein